MQNLVKNELNQYETLNQSSNLDYTIIEKEVFAASKKLKNNKASAYDLLKNKMIKSALPSFFPNQLKASLHHGIFEILQSTYSGQKGS